MAEILVVKAAIEKDGKFLALLRNSTEIRFPNCWDLPGGKIEPGEELKDALKREVFEETKLILAEPKFVFQKEFDMFDNHYVFNLFLAKIKNSDIELSDEHTEYNWFTKEELKKLDLDPAVKMFLEK